MKLTIFHSDKGDCTLLTGRDGKRILADGGMAVSYTEFVAPRLTKLRQDKANKRIDVVYVSHIDDDHIGGVLRMLDDAVDWRIFDHKSANGAKLKAPASARPPEIGEIWHNGFREQVGQDAGPIEDQLASNAAALSGAVGLTSLSDSLRGAVAEHQDLAQSVQQAIRLGRRVRDGELGIPLNKPAKGKLMMVRKPSKLINVGKMNVRIVGPQSADLVVLRKKWIEWVNKSGAILASIDADSKKDEGDLAASAGRFADPLLADAAATARALVDVANDVALGDLDKALGQRTTITPPNLASLMLLVTEGQQTILLTGDGFADDALAGLRSAKILGDSGLHVNVLKVPHHGAAGNMTDLFARTVTADHYVFCGNGFAENPELVVIKRLFDARQGSEELRSTNAEVDNPFTFWFNCDSKLHNETDQKQHMAQVEKFVAGLKKTSKGKMKVKFLSSTRPSFDIDLDA